MLADLSVLCDEGDRLQGEGRLVDALNRYHEALDHLRALSGADTATLSLRVRAAKSAVTILIGQNGNIDEIYTLLAEERAALVDLIDVPVSPERLHHRLSAFRDAVKANDESAAKQSFTSVLGGLFGRIGPADALGAHIAVIQNILTKAAVIFDREGDADDARALAETALSEILTLLPNTSFNIASHPAIPMVTATLNLLTRLNGRDAGWFERAKIVCTLLPIALTPWSLGLIQSSDIAALMLGLGEPEAV